MSFIESIIQKEFVGSASTKNNRLAIAYQDNFLAAYEEIEKGTYGYLDSARQLSGTLLYKKALLSPFNDCNVVFTLGKLSAGASDQVVFSLIVYRNSRRMAI